MSEHCFGDLLPTGGTFHSFRATFATWAVETGFTDELAQRALGHVVGRLYDRIIPML